MSLQEIEFKKYEKGDRPSASDLNARSDMLSKIGRSLFRDGLIDSTGFLGRHSTAGKGVNIKLFEVQSAATGDGVYTCYEQTLDATEWDDTAGDSKIDDRDAVEVEVLNLAEFDPEATYVAHLAANDLIVAWRKTDDESNLRWIGLPLRQANADRPRVAYCKDAAGASTTITCYLDTDGTGTEITVYCSIAGGGNLNTAIPRLADGTLILVSKIGATWRCMTTFMISCAASGATCA